MAVPPSRLRGRGRRTTWLYDDPAEPGRVTGTVDAPDWTSEDRAALLGLEEYESSLCGGCGQPRDVAWQVEGQHNAHSWVCDGCTARARHEAEHGDGDPSAVKPVRHVQVYRRHDAPEDLDATVGPLTMPHPATDEQRAAIPADWLT